MRGILVVGHSHVGALRHAAIRRRQAGGLPYMVRTLNVFDSRFGPPASHRFDADNIPLGFLEEVRRIIAKRDPMVCTVIGGNDHAMMALNRSDEPWDFELLAEESPPLDPHAKILLEAEVYNRLATVMNDSLGAMARLRAEIGPFWQIESPPPVASQAFIAANIEAFFTDRPEYSRKGISPIGLRYRMWRLSCRIFAEQCRKLGCGYVPVPQAVFDQVGCLDERLAGDSTHGNIEFGQHILALLWQSGRRSGCERLIAMGAVCRWRSCEDVEDGLPDGWHARLRRRSPDSFFSVPRR